MTIHPILMRSAVRKRVFGALSVITAVGAVVFGGTAHAEPGQDSLANLRELSREAEELTGTMRAAQADFDQKMRLLGDADRKHSEDLAVLEATKAQLAVGQGTVDKIAAAVYMGGRSDGLTAILTAGSPKNLIDKLAVQRVMNTQAHDQMQSYRRVTLEAQALEAESAKSAAEARAAIDAAASVRAELQKKQSELRAQIAEVAEHAVLTSAPSSVMAALGVATPVPTVGMSGLVPNARRLVQYIMVTYPGVRSIGGVRADPIPDHPSGRAVDIMVDDMALGDAINADIQRQAGRFGVVYTMWRVAAHFDHIHITVS